MSDRKALASARAFVLMGKDFEILVEMCALSPIKNDWKIWKDISGNTVKILENKSIKICLTKKPDETKTNDIFVKSLPSKIAEYSNVIMVIKDEVSNRDLICFLGNDGRLRVSFFENGIWKSNYLPLTIGISVITMMMKRSSKPIPKVNFSDFVPSSVIMTDWPTKNKKVKGDIECLLRKTDM